MLTAGIVVVAMLMAVLGFQVCAMALPWYVEWAGPVPLPWQVAVAAIETIVFAVFVAGGIIYDRKLERKSWTDAGIVFFGGPVVLVIPIVLNSTPLEPMRYLVSGTLLAAWLTSAFRNEPSMYRQINSAYQDVD